MHTFQAHTTCAFLGISDRLNSLLIYSLWPSRRLGKTTRSVSLCPKEKAISISTELVSKKVCRQDDDHCGAIWGYPMHLFLVLVCCESSSKSAPAIPEPSNMLDLFDFDAFLRHPPHVKEPSSWQPNSSLSLYSPLRGVDDRRSGCRLQHEPPPLGLGEKLINNRSRDFTSQDQTEHEDTYVKGKISKDIFIGNGQGGGT
ncbi:hypothetical protein PILCRDRAFT_719041 [Piloderma croceum F 1598]|uniref:Uncharacterized protein n=1 Tax=Piloderma croceum (strain F 1598) TaxID=765440 RepID=A0A0C3F1I3_PILCF|nr:hypothetical protein PILCRDRAFT_719041 [Piloderma croceum F 1598]